MRRARRLNAGTVLVPGGYAATIRERARPTTGGPRAYHARVELHLVRHADAEPQREALDDADRALTEKGHAQARSLAKALGALDIRYACLLTSPKRRARETAASLAGRADRTELEPLLAEPPSEALLARLSTLVASGTGPLGLVGHEPYLGGLTALLLGLPGQGERFAFKKGGLYLVSWPGAGKPEPAELRLALTPEVLARL